MTPCPKCKTLTPTHYNPLYILCAILFFPFGLLALLAPKMGTCPKCGAEVKSDGMKLI